MCFRDPNIWWIFVGTEKKRKDSPTQNCLNTKLCKFQVTFGEKKAVPLFWEGHKNTVNKLYWGPA